MATSTAMVESASMDSDTSSFTPGADPGGRRELRGKHGRQGVEAGS